MDEYVDGVVSGNRTVLARTITLVESNAPAHFDLAQNVLKAVIDNLPDTQACQDLGRQWVPG